jgi:ketosteroid isomerase-like protein
VTPASTAQSDPPAELVEAAHAWLLAMERCVRALDYEGARELFHPEAVGFGTVAAHARGRETLEQRQWRRVWSRTREFRFRLNEMWCAGGEDALSVAVPWDSVGVAEGGATFDRPGRATLVLTRRNGELVAVHSHFSLLPGGRG